MHRPPAASHTVQRSRWHLVCIVSTWLIAAAACAGHWQSAAGPGSKIALLASLSLLGLWAGKDWFDTEQGRLRWDGQQWLWSGFGDVPVQQLFVVLDFQRLILVKLQANHVGARWIWLEAPKRSRQWLAMRRAIVGTVAHS
jgi:toxin CptA